MTTLFENRRRAGEQLAETLKGLELRDPLVLAIPRGGIEVGVALSVALDAELDVILARKLRSPEQPELALGAVSECGEVYLSDAALRRSLGPDDLSDEQERQRHELEESRRLYRSARPRADYSGRSLIVTDDGVATGSTLISALRTAAGRDAHEVIAAVPVLPAEHTETIAGHCDRLVYITAPSHFDSVGRFYRDFASVSDERVADILARCAV